MDALDYLWAVRDFPAARARREAADKLEALHDRLLANEVTVGQVEITEDGVKVEHLEGNLNILHGLNVRMAQLEAAMGLEPRDIDLDQMVREAVTTRRHAKANKNLDKLERLLGG